MSEGARNLWLHQRFSFVQVETIVPYVKFQIPAGRGPLTMAERADLLSDRKLWKIYLSYEEGFGYCESYTFLKENVILCDVL